MTPITPKERREMERRSKRREGLLRRKYPEVHGKVLDFITHTIDDGTLYFTEDVGGTMERRSDSR